jgi:putative transposase
MKAPKCSDPHKAFIPKQGTNYVAGWVCPVKPAAARQSISTGMKKMQRTTADEMGRLKQLEDENAKLKRIVEDLSLDKEMLHDAIRQQL